MVKTIYGAWLFKIFDRTLISKIFQYFTGQRYFRLIVTSSSKLTQKAIN
ncbi:MAG: hypothetical protein RIQ59_125 [Bacteroidota bacterium]|jgi:hypothetical protein